MGLIYIYIYIYISGIFGIFYIILNCELGLADGKLVRWTKGFNCEGVEGKNVVDLLQEALARRGDVQIEICAILNDTTGNFLIKISRN